MGSCYSGQIESTTGTIMSYCGDYTLTFSSREQTLLEDNLAADGCLTAARNPSYVDIANTGAETGTSADPWNTFNEGLRGVVPGGTVLIAPGAYPETFAGQWVIHAPATLGRWGSAGTVVIGAP